MAEHVLWNIVFEFFHQRGAFRARSHTTHVTLKNIDKLGKFVKRRTSQKTANPCDTGVVLCSPYCTRFSFGVHAHGAKFKHLENATIKTHTFLFMNNRARTENFYG